MSPSLVILNLPLCHSERSEESQSRLSPLPSPISPGPLLLKAASPSPLAGECGGEGERENEERKKKAKGSKISSPGVIPVPPVRNSSLRGSGQSLRSECQRPSATCWGEGRLSARHPGAFHWIPAKNCGNDREVLAGRTGEDGGKDRGSSEIQIDEQGTGVTPVVTCGRRIRSIYPLQPVTRRPWGIRAAIGF